MGKTLELNNNNNREMDVLKRIEERKAQQDLDVTKRVNTRKQQLHYLFLFIVCLLILDSLG